ncbi:MAG TPA: Gfo/Idh/MocA family oxidoreductase [Chitinophagaceae bacterium]|nr:Gfo/Idh/MocA family oxidoreductase [Chitinophagaceae bacterium]
MANNKLKMGMIGGGPGAFIGAVHRIAANMDGEIELVCGAFSSDEEKSKQQGAILRLAPQRVYGSYKEMIRREAELPIAERMDFVSIVTPNHLHFEPSKLALESGFHVVLDKPMTFDLAEAKQLKEIAAKSGKYFCLTHTYTGYPMVKEARQQVLSGKFGNIRKVYVEYPQGWLSTFLESSNQKQAAWRTDPSKSGVAGAMGDIGTHAFNLAEYVSGLQVTKICADINIVLEKRKLDDDGAALLKFNNGSSGVLFATQIAAGEENNIKIRVYGEKGGLEWKQEEANTLLIKWLDKPTEVWRAGTGYLGSFASHNSRTPSGHPEGYLEAFANHYRNFSFCVQAQKKGEQPKQEWLDFPGIEDGVRGMAFIETVIASGKSKEKWMDLKT